MKIDLNISVKKDDSAIALLFCASLSYNVIALVINTLVNMILPNTPLDTMVCMAVYAYFIVSAIPAIAKRISAVDIVFVIIVLAVYLLHMTIYPQNEPMLSDAMPNFFFSVLPFFFLGRAIRDYDMVLSYFKKLSDYMVYIGFAYYLILIVADLELKDDNMSFAYYYLPFAIMSIYGIINFFSPANLLHGVVSCATLILTGTRGPILCLFAALLMFIYFYQKKTSTKLVWTFLLVGIAIFLFSDLFMVVANRLYLFLYDMGIENRILEKILTEDLLHGSGRDEISEALINAIRENPLVGYGLRGDRLIANTYAHNLVLELFINFGIPIGAFILCILLAFVFRALGKKNVSLGYKVLTILLVSTIFVKLMVSGSYIQEPKFFLLLGFVSARAVTNTYDTDKKSMGYYNFGVRKYEGM